MTTQNCVHALWYGLWKALNVIDCELHPTDLFGRAYYVFCAIFQEDLL